MTDNGQLASAVLPAECYALETIERKNTYISISSTGKNVRIQFEIILE